MGLAPNTFWNDKSIFSLYLTSKLYYTGMYTYGYYDVEKYSYSGLESEVMWMDLNDNNGKRTIYNYWAVDMSYTREIGLPDRQRTLIIDSGFDKIIVPNSDLAALWLWYDKKYKDDKKFDEVVFRHNDGNITMECPPKYYDKELIAGMNVNVKAYSGEDRLGGDKSKAKWHKINVPLKAVFSPTTEVASGNTNRRIYVSNVIHDKKFKPPGGQSENRSYWVMGTPFLVNFYSIYDPQNK